MKNKDSHVCKSTCQDIPINSTQSALDNSNTSSALRFSERIRTRKPRKVYMGQPTHLNLFRATFTTVRLQFRYTGAPIYFDVVATSNLDSHNYQFTLAQYNQYQFWELTGLTPNTIYTIELYATYISGDKFSGNYQPKIRTSFAEGAVKDLTLNTPVNQFYDISNTDYFTSLTVNFTPLKNIVDYKITIVGTSYNIVIPYEQIQEYAESKPKPIVYSRTFDQLQFNHNYEVIVETLYGDENDRYIYSISQSIKTVNEKFLSSLSLLYLYNQAIDLSYSEVLPNVQYKFYLNDIERKHHQHYSSTVLIDNLSIYEFYYATISVVFPETNNEYNNKIDPILGTYTLQESSSGFSQALVKNTSIDMSFVDASGTNEVYYFTIDPSTNVQIDYSKTSQNSIYFTDLLIDTEYRIQIRTEYPPYNFFPNFNDTSNNYVVEKTFRTLNQGPVFNLQATELVKIRSDVKLTYDHAPNFLSSGGYYQIKLDSTIVTVRSHITRYTFNNIDSGDHTYSVKAVYNPTDLIPSYDYESSGTIDVETLQTGPLKIDESETEILGTSIALVKSNDEKTNHNKYSITFTNQNNGTDIKSFPNVLTWGPNDIFLIDNLLPNTSYHYEIISYYDHSTDVFTTNGVLTTLNEDRIDISDVYVGNTFATITWTIIGSNNVQYNIHCDGSSTSLENNTITLTDLSINQMYNYTIDVLYLNTENVYTTHHTFTTLNEGNPSYNISTVFHHPQYGNTAIIESLPISNPANTTIIVNDMSFVGTTTLDFSLVSLHEVYNGSIVVEYEPNVSEDPLITFQSSSPYRTDFSFNAIMNKPITTVENDAIDIIWVNLDGSTNDVSYNITLTNLNTGDVDMSTVYQPVEMFRYEDLSINTSYEIEFTRNSMSRYFTEKKTVQTLFESPIQNIQDSIVLNSGYGNLIVLDISNVNGSNVKENRFTLNGTNESYSTENNLVDIQLHNVNNTLDFSGVIETFYYDPPSTSDIFTLYKTKPYVSNTLDFSLNSLQINDLLLNSDLDFSNQSHLFDSNSGIAVDEIPSYWSGDSVFVMDNSNGTLSSDKYLSTTTGSHVGLYPSNQASTFPAVSQIIQPGYLFKSHYNLLFYVTNHLVEGLSYGPTGLPYRGGLTENSIEYQIQIYNPEDGIIYESNPLLSNDLSWNQVQMKFFVPKSFKNASLRIQRNFFELNHLLLSDFSMVSLNAEYSPLPSLDFFTNKWSQPAISSISPWKSMYDYNQDTIVQLSTNMTLEFWLYIHDADRTTKPFLAIGKEASNDFHFVYSIRKQNISFENAFHYKPNDKHKIEKVTSFKQPIFYQVVYQNNTIQIYQNGNSIIDESPKFYLGEIPKDHLIYLGNPHKQIFGHILREVKFYNFPFSPAQIQTSYNRKKSYYSTVGNYSEIAEAKLLNTNVFSSIPTMTTVQYNLHNGSILTKTLALYNLEHETLPTISIEELLLPYTISFWLRNSVDNQVLFEIANSEMDVSMNLLNNQNTLGISENEKFNVPINSSDLEHFVLVFDINETQLYKNGYLYEISPTLGKNFPKSDPDPISLHLSFGPFGEMGDFQLYNTALTQQQVFTSYVNHYTGIVLYTMIGGIYTVQISNVDGSTYDSLEYEIQNIPSEISTLSVDISGSLQFTTNENGESIASLDISMSDLDLNVFNLNLLSFDLVLPDFGITTVVDGSSGFATRTPYLEAIHYVLEGNSFQLILHNVDKEYHYIISGTDITGSDISGGVLEGTIQNTKTIAVRDDYKTELLETMKITISELNLATSIDISDNTQNLLSILHNESNIGSEMTFVKDDVFVVQLNWPEQYSSSSILPNELNYTVSGDAITDVLTLIDGNESNPTATSRKGIFTLVENRIVFKVNTDESQRELLLTLDEYDSSVRIIMNDFVQPRLLMSPTNESNSTFEINEGDQFTVKLEVPIQWSESNTFTYEISSLTSADISYSSDPLYDPITMSGKFVLDLENNERSQEFIFTANQDRNVEGDEDFTIILTDPSYNTIESNLLKIINTSKAFYYILTISGENVSDISGIKYIDEGSEFEAILNTSDLDRTFNYTMGGMITQSDLDIGTVNGTFEPGIMSRTFKIREDTTNEGDESFFFNIQINNLNVIQNMVIRDTSQKPIYTLEAIQPDDVPNTFYIDVTNTNYEQMTNTQKAIEIQYSIEGDTIDSSMFSGTLDNVQLNVQSVLTGSFTFGTLSVKRFVYIYTSSADDKTITIKMDNIGLERTIRLSYVNTDA